VTNNNTPSDAGAGASIDIASYLDHTLLAVAATDADVEQLCADGVKYMVAAVCVSPSKVPVAIGAVDGALPVAAVAGFPSGAHPSVAKVADAVYAVEAGAAEVDMVVNLGLVADGRWDAVESDIAEVRRAVPSPVLLKIIIESATLTDEEIVACCRAAEAAGADFVKTSTGFHPDGGASEAAVRLMAATVDGRLGVKASGGIRTRQAALAMIAAGATRLGTSSTQAILTGS
jgi:deoxyribose-phosphate aldolase